LIKYKGFQGRSGDDYNAHCQSLQPSWRVSCSLIRMLEIRR
jgi:hypothetical protein